MEEQFKAQIAVLDSMQHAAPDAQAPILEQQEANIRDELRFVPKEHTAAYHDHKEAHKAAMEALDAGLKAQTAVLISQHGGASEAQASLVEQQENEIRSELDRVSNHIAA